MGPFGVGAVSILWRRALLMWVKFPAVAIAVFSVTAIAAMTSVSGPAFLASTEEGSLREGIQPNRWVAGYRIAFPNFAFNEVERGGIEGYERFISTLEDFFSDRFAEEDLVGDVHLSLAPASAMSVYKGNQRVNVRPAFRTNALEHVTHVEGIDGQGAWLDDGSARELGAHPGDSIRLGFEGEEMEVEVAGVYQHLPTEAPRRFWSSMAPLIYRPAGSFFDPPPLLLVDRQTYMDIVEQLGVSALEDRSRHFGGMSLEVPVAVPEMPLSDAEELVAYFDETTQEIRTSLAQPRTPDRFAYENVDAETSLTGIVDTARKRSATVTPVTDVLSTGAEILALTLMASTGFFLVRRRRIEVATLAVRGVGPFGQATRLGSEMLIPVLVGAVLGTVAGFQLVSALGPAQDIPIATLTGALSSVAAVVGAGVVLMVLVAALSVRREERAVAEVPPVLAVHHMLIVGLVVAAGAIFLGSRMVRDISGLDTQALRDPSVTSAPIIMILGAAVLAAALFRAGLPFLARAVRYKAPWLYLAARRLSGASMLTQALVLATVCSLGIAVYAFTISSSIDATADAKARVFIGSDLSVVVTDVGSLPRDLGFPWTGVTRIGRMPAASGDVSMLGVNPETFAEGGFWSEQFSDISLQEMLDAIDVPAEPPLKVIATEDLGSEVTLQSSSGTVPLEVVASVNAFPGMPPGGRFVIMSQESLSFAQSEMGASTGTVTDEIWGKGERTALEGALAQRGVVYGRPLSAEAVLDTPGLQSLLWMLGLLSALGGGAAVICMVGLLLYLQARQRASLISSVMTRRMGLSRRSELLTWGSEIVGALLVALMGAAIAGLAVSSVMADRLDPRPALVPGPILVVPVTLLVVLAAVMLTVGAVSAWFIRRSMDRADVAAAMRT